MEGDRNSTLAAITKSVFYATSPKQLARALAQRCKILHQNELYDEAIEDGLKVLKVRICFHFSHIILTWQLALSSLGK